MSRRPTSRLPDVGRFRGHSRAAFFCTWALLGSALGGCGAEQCLSNQQFYEQKVWAEVVAKTCIKCHAPEGVAALQNAKFLQYSQSFPGFLELNLANITEIAKTQYEGTSRLLLKPVGKLDHGGGAIISEGSQEHKTLEEMVRRAESPVSCGEQSEDPSAAAVTVMHPAATLRKASLQLAGRLPTDAELATVLAGGEEALGPALDALLNEQAFYDRLKEIYNDLLLTGRYTGRGLSLLNDNDYPGKYWYNPGKLPDGALTPEQLMQRQLSDYGVSAEPLELIAYVARNDKPFREILTADYTVVNPYSARVYGLDPSRLGFASLGDYSEFRPAQVAIAQSGGMLALPHAGVLTTPAFLNRYPTTNTNVNRARARFTFKFFLATDLLAVAERPIDPSSVTSTNPTRDDPYCTPCHKIIDPVAGTFQKWDYAGRFNPLLSWSTALPQPGFGKQVVDNVNQYPAALQWLAQRLVQDPRFATSVMNTVYKGIMGQDPVSYPVAGDPSFMAKQKAWQEQDRIFQSILASYKAGGENVKLIFKGLIMSPLYRAESARDIEPVQAEIYGTGRFLTPELLSRKITAALGIHWWRYDKRDILPTDYNLLYGGIDFDDITSRLTVPNGIMASIAQRMANEMSCQVTAWDFTKAQRDRRLFKHVQVSNTPEDDNGYAIPESISDIRRNIQYLHQRLLGESLLLEDPEIERTYQLFLKTWRELHAAGSTSLPYDCQGRWNRETGDPLPAAQIVVTEDKYYTVQSWMAVLTYLLLDYKFLEE